MKILTQVVITMVSLALWSLVYFFGVVLAGVILIAFPWFFLLMAIIFVVYGIKHEADRG